MDIGTLESNQKYREGHGIYVVSDLGWVDSRQWTTILGEFQIEKGILK